MGFFDSAVSRPGDRSADHDHRGDVAGAAGPEHSDRVEAGALYIARDRRPRRLRALHHHSGPETIWQPRRSRSVHRGGLIHLNLFSADGEFTSTLDMIRHI